MALTRLDKLLCDSGAATRSQARNMIKQGRVSIDGVVCLKSDTKVSADSEVTLDGQALRTSKFIYLMMNKPRGVLSATEDRTQSTVIDLLDESIRRMGIFPVGRLDKDTTGLLLLTNDGDFAHSIVSPRRHVPKRYLAHTRGSVSDEDIKLFKSGVVLSDGTVCLPAVLERLDGDKCIVTVEEGKYHQVKRMLASCGKPVVSLHRLSVGGLELDAKLQTSQYRELTEAEKLSIFSSI